MQNLLQRWAIGWARGLLLVLFLAFSSGTCQLMEEGWGGRKVVARAGHLAREESYRP